jgi:hypothetical protein
LRPASRKARFFVEPYEESSVVTARHTLRLGE